MADDKKSVGGANTDQTFADRGGAPGAAGGNQPVATGDTARAAGDDPTAYRDRGDNGARRARHLERVVIDNFYGGSTDRFDTDAGLDREA